MLYEANEVVTVYPEEVWTDADGNTMVRPSKVGTESPAMIRLASVTGASSTAAEQQSGGTLTVEAYNIRFPRGSAGEALGELGPNSVIDWNGQRFSIHGMPRRFNGSARTRRVEYLLIRR